MDRSRSGIPSTCAIGLSVTMLVLVSYAVQAEPQERAAGTAPAAAAAGANGRQLFASAGCAQCHGDVGQGANAGPRLVASAIPLKRFIDAVRTPPLGMPRYGPEAVSDAQLAEIHAFLASAPPPPTSQPASAAPAGDAANGQKLFNAVGCWSCHGYSAQGARTGSRLAPNPIPFEAFVRYIRAPARDMPPYTQKVISDAQLADIYAFLRSVPEPRRLQDIPELNR